MIIRLLLVLGETKTMVLNLLQNYKALLKASHMPEWLDPMLATLTSKRFSDLNWRYECKFDGVRALIFKNEYSVKVFSRNKIDISINYPELVQAFSKQTASSFIMDGEIVAFKKKVSSFSKLQQRMQISNARKLLQAIPIFYYVFDILYLDKFLLANLPLLNRKDILNTTIEYQDPIRFAEYILNNRINYYKNACKNGLEGIIAKKAGPTYKRKHSKKWLKFKCICGQEFVIGGFAEPKSSKKNFGALLIGYYKGNKLRYAGKVGAGFNNKLLIDLRKSFSKMARSQLPFHENISEKFVNWINPNLIAEIEFSEWASAGKLRHPHFKDL